MTPNPCAALHAGKPCGLTPTITECTRDGFQVLQVRCACGNHGAAVFYRKPEDEARTKRSTIDGWNRGQFT